jgi:hypothetical protein
LYRLLYEIEEDLPWRGIDFRRIFHDHDRSLDRNQTG